MTAPAGITETVTSGPFLLAAALSVAAGAVSFASPCCVPLVPGYLSYLAGLVGAETSATAEHAPSTQEGASGRRRGSTPAGAVRAARARVLAATALFVLGFTVVFMAQTVLVLGVGHALLANNDVLLRVGGGVTILMGLVMLGLFKPLQRDARLLRLRAPGTLLGAPVLGASFGLGWVVCVGPTLTGVIALATATDWGGNAWRGLFLVLFYCLGLGLPFLLLAFGFGWATTGLAFLRRHARTIQVIGGVTLIALGLLMITGVWGAFIATLQGAVAGNPRLL